MKKSFTSFLILISLFAFSQTPPFQWAKKVAGNFLDDGTSITTDKNGFVYTCGHFNSVCYVDPPSSSGTLIPNGDSDAFISKLDCEGNFLWAKQIGGIGKDVPYSVVCDSMSNVYVSGSFSNIVDFDPGTGTYTLTSNGNSDIFLLKLDPLGNFIWVKQFGSTGIDEGFSVTLDKNGDVYMTGTFWGSVDFDPGIGSYILTSSGAQDIFVLKLTSLGNFNYAKNLGGLSYEAGLCIKVDMNKNVYTTGWFQGLADFDPSSSTFTLQANSWSTDIFVSKLDSLGNFVWAAITGGSSQDYGYSLGIDSKENVIITGFFQNTSDFDPGPSIFNISSAGNLDIFAWKLDRNGNFKWVKQIGGPIDDVGYSLAIDSQDNIYTTGSYEGIVDFDPGPGIFNLANAGYYDIFINKSDTLGNLVWAAQMGGGQLEHGLSMNVDRNSNIYITGWSQDNVDFNPGSAIDTIYYFSNSDDAYIVKLGQSCATNLASIKSPSHIFKIFPNPTKGELTLKVNNPIVKSEVKIFNSIGQTILQNNILSSTTNLNILNQPSGIYFIEVNADGESYRAKVVKE